MCAVQNDTDEGRYTPEAENVFEIEFYMPHATTRRNEVLQGVPPAPSCAVSLSDIFSFLCWSFAAFCFPFFRLFLFGDFLGQIDMLSSSAWLRGQRSYKLATRVT